MDFDSYSERLTGLNEFSKEFFKKPQKIEQKRFQIINESMQIKSVSKVQFRQLNDKRFYFSNGLISLPYGHPYLEDLRKEKHKYRTIHSHTRKKIRLSKGGIQDTRKDTDIKCFKINF